MAHCADESLIAAVESPEASGFWDFHFAVIDIIYFDAAWHA